MIFRCTHTHTPRISWCSYRSIHLCMCEICQHHRGLGNMQEATCLAYNSSPLFVFLHTTPPLNSSPSEHTVDTVTCHISPLWPVRAFQMIFQGSHFQAHDVEVIAVIAGIDTDSSFMYDNYLATKTQKHLQLCTYTCKDMAHASELNESIVLLTWLFVSDRSDQHQVRGTWHHRQVICTYFEGRPCGRGTRGSHAVCNVLKVLEIGMVRLGVCVAWRSFSWWLQGRNRVDSLICRNRSGIWHKQMSSFA